LGESLPDVDLVARAVAGDADAFVELCERHKSRVWRIASSVARGADAEDLSQEVLVRAYRSLKTFQGQAPFAAWLCRIAVNAAYDHQRSAWQRRVTLVEQVPGEEETTEHLEGTVERREVQRRVRAAVATLPDNQRVPIWLHFFEGFSIVEVARLERAPEATVRSRMRAGMRRLSLSLEDLMPAGDPRYSFETGPHGCGA
jgi:RNA polymerase sigma-70 factor (ECF subfamily)